MVCIAKENNVKIFTLLWWHAAVFLLDKGGELMLEFDLKLMFEVLFAGAPFH